jgi:hypothetical protein
MKFLRLTALVLAACASLAMAKKYPVTVRFYAEAHSLDGATFSTPIKFESAKREGHIEKVPSISERNITAIYPFRAPDGTMGCAFKLDNSGRIALSVMSTERRGTALVAFVGTKNGVHQVIDMTIDRPVNDGIITIQRGLTTLEVVALRKQWPTMGEEKGKKTE